MGNGKVQIGGFKLKLVIRKKRSWLRIGIEDLLMGLFWLFFGGVLFLGINFLIKMYSDTLVTYYLVFNFSPTQLGEIMDGILWLFLLLGTAAIFKLVKGMEG